MQKKSTSRSAPARRSLSTRRSFTRRVVGEGGFFNLRALIGVLFCAATACFILIPIRSGLAFLHAPSNVSQRTLTFEERVSYQRAIEDVYWRHRIWPKERPDPKPSLDAVMSQAQLEKKVADYLRNSRALEDYWQRPFTAEQLQAEIDRMAQHSKQPEMLSELFEALGNDPFVIAECLARPALAERLVTNWYASDERIHGELKQHAEAELQTNPSTEQMKRLSGKYSEIEFVKSDSGKTVGQARRLPNGLAGGAPALHPQGSTHSVTLNSREWDEAMQRLAAIFNKPGSRLLKGGDPAGAGSRPLDRADAYETIPIGKLSSLQEDETCYYATAVIKNTRDHLKLATVSWLKEPFESWRARAENQVPTATGAPSATYRLAKISGGGCIEDSWTATNGPPDARSYHTAVWTGSEMIVWGGLTAVLTNSGGRYAPSTDSWTPTSTTNAPAARDGHTAVWTGSEMIVWGGGDASNNINTGGKYNPSADDWTATSTTNAPTPRFYYTAVWTGSEMIVWGGEDESGNSLNTGGRYNPNTDSWTATSTTNVPDIRHSHTAVWSGNEMIVWGGFGTSGFLNTGGRYNPNTDIWTPTNTTNAPTPRDGHTAVWTGSEMIVWGGGPSSTGGRYSPNTDNWTATTTTNAPDPRIVHTAVWTGSEMIIWGGLVGTYVNMGGSYNPSTDTWVATSTTDAPTGRGFHTAVWTGDEMIVWGGFDNNIQLASGGRYDPATDSWTATSSNIPSGRELHTAVWTGSEMIIWGGFDLTFFSTDTGGRYDPATDSWIATSTTNAPPAREQHTAVWSGSEMIIWGGASNVGYFNTGGRYNPAANSWTATSTTNAPSGRSLHTAVWTDNEMIVWGGFFYDGSEHYLNTGGRYNPNTDTWTSIGTTSDPSGRDSHTAVWTGTEMIVWGGFDGNNGFNTGGKYNPETDSWTATSTANAPVARDGHTAVWSGGEMIVWGGHGNGYLNNGARYNPSTDSWTAAETATAPSPRSNHTAVWTGSEMIVWGGYFFDGNDHFLNTGGRYSPSADSWTVTSTTNAPSGRGWHTAIWTGSEMTVWGGVNDDFDVVTSTGGRYCAQSGPTPTPTPTPTPSISPTPTPSPSVTPTVTPTTSPTPTATPRVTPRPRPTPRRRPTPP
jgi:N-acetylneuraminic acid mutarotase